MKSVGLCLGASRVSAAILEKNSSGIITIKDTDTLNHDGNIIGTLKLMLDKYSISAQDKVVLTGRKLRDRLNMSAICEAQAVELAYRYLQHKYLGCDAIVSAGGESFLTYKLDSNGCIVSVFTGNKCASGTGEFFLQQLARMNLAVADAAKIADINNPYNVAGRCSVFCKSDCTHALNKGEAKGKVVAGLCKMMATKIIELLKKCQPRTILLIGGSTLNTAMVSYLKQQLQPHQSLYTAAEACYFEALGAALWAQNNPTLSVTTTNKYTIQNSTTSFSLLPPLKNYTDKVIFKSMDFGQAEKADECIVGLDVGSTTTKAVIIRAKDNTILASVYLRTNGDPIEASKTCYKELSRQLTVPVSITGLGVTGSGRQIAALHAGTDGVVNEIIAHATAAVYFDPEVDTIFEIGGQDAKYTFLTNKVAADYAMNEACSAGTGSFLEEAAKETMGINTTEIANLAIEATAPPNFNDQCAAFISSDIKTAVHEGIAVPDILAGLVYSVCQNYTNRVKGNRLIGTKIFMQGGVCYNKAVPLAMAALTGKSIIVPPEPGLMGAFGVALEIKNKIYLGLIKKSRFNLADLATRQATYGKTFACSGGKEYCDRKCEIKMIEIAGQSFPFGGACNKYANLRRNIKPNTQQLDLIALREKLIFNNYVATKPINPTQKVGIIKSLMVNSLYPLYYNFFTGLGYEVVLADYPKSSGIERKGAAFCYPVEQAHGFIADLLDKEVDYIFLPHVMGMPVQNGIKTSVTCPLAQGEPYYLTSAFPELKNKKVLRPMLDFSRGYERLAADFTVIGKDLLANKKSSLSAYQTAVNVQRQCLAEMCRVGQQTLAMLDANSDKIGIVLFGRPYSAFAKQANMGIPNKFASRGVLIFPWEFLPHESEDPVHHMFWSMGQMLLKSAKYIKEHPQLFGAYITNFSCGPDSFIISQFRDIMARKPSLTLELDGHNADAGIDTRIEAFLDVIHSYRQLSKHSKISQRQTGYLSAKTATLNGQYTIIDSKNKPHLLTNPSVQVVVPSMGHYGARLIAASLRYNGINASYLKPGDINDLATGRANSSCKECLPYILVTGSILNDITVRRKDLPDKVLAYFVADSSGPCRFGQYHIAMQNLIKKNNIENVAIMSITSDDGYAGLGSKFQTRAWQSIIVADVLSDIYNALLVLATDKNSALASFYQCVDSIEQAIAAKPWTDVKQALTQEANKLAKIPISRTIHDVPTVSLVGEIFVRQDDFSRQHLVEKLAGKGILTYVAPIHEFIYYCDYILQKSFYHVDTKFSEKATSILKSYFKRYYEKEIKQIFATSGLYHYHLLNIPELTNKVNHLISAKYTAGDATLTVAGALTEIVDKTDGVIAIGPFGCMPSRVAEAILAENISNEKTAVAADKIIAAEVLRRHPALPFLSIESDGNPFPQLVERKLEIFCIQVERIHHTLKELRVKKH